MQIVYSVDSDKIGPSLVSIYSLKKHNPDCEVTLYTPDNVSFNSDKFHRTQQLNIWFLQDHVDFEHLTFEKRLLPDFRSTYNFTEAEWKIMYFLSNTLIIDNIKEFRNDCIIHYDLDKLPWKIPYRFSMSRNYKLYRQYTKEVCKLIGCTRTDLFGEMK